MWSELVDHVIERLPQSIREKLRAGPEIDDWHDDLLGESELQRIEQQPKWMRELVQSVKDEVEAVRREHDKFT